MGTWLQGFPWDLYFTGTFTTVPPDPLKVAEEFHHRIRHLSRATYYGHMTVLEKRDWSGCGKPSIRPHIHSLIAYAKALRVPRNITRLWHASYGKCDCQQYDPSLSGAYYICKEIPRGAEYLIDGLVNFQNSITDGDFVAAAEFVPDHLKHCRSGSYLRVANEPTDGYWRVRD
jgi:hypothetical protein